VPYLAVAFLTLLLLLPATPAAAQVQPDVYASGMRNPYRWSFDRQTGDMYVGDVGGTNEEITFLPAAQSRGANLGWNCFSGTAVESGCTPSNYFPPSYQYPSSEDVVIGGYLVRDPALPSFQGQYLFGRFDSGIIMKLGAQAAPPATDTGLKVPNVSGFGEDGVGHLYATSLAGGVYLLGQNAGGTLTKASIGDFNQPVAVAAPPGDPNQLFIVEKPGRVLLRTPAGTNEFLNLTSQVEDGGEQGLLALAVSPDYAVTHRVFVFYDNNGGDLQLEEYRDGVRKPVITIQHDQADNHNGGQLLFGLDGGLYLSTGDGGTQGDPEGDAQNPNSLLGKILRFDVGAGAPPPTGTSDTAPPVVSLRVPRHQRVLRRRGAVAYVRCSEACTVFAGGTLRIGRRKLLLRHVTVTARSSPSKRLRVQLKKRSARLLRHALADGRRPRVQIRLSARDAAGNHSALLRRSLRVRR
jgi:glucose/arabinose dehydrogenase